MAVKVKITESLLKQLSFSRRLVAVGPKGPRFEATPEGCREWSLYDSEVVGLFLRVRPTSMIWTIRRRMGGSPKPRRIGAYQSNAGGKVFGIDKAREWAKAQLGLMADHVDPAQVRRERGQATRQADERRSVTLAVAFADYHAMKTPAELGHGEKVDPQTRKLKNKVSSTADRAKVPAWMAKCPVWRKPLVELTGDDITTIYQPLIDHILRKKPMPAWGPVKRTLSAGTLNKMWTYVSAAYHWKAKAMDLSPRQVELFKTWKQEYQGEWPKTTAKPTYLKTVSPEGQVWLQTLRDLREKATDPALLEMRPDPRGKSLKPHVAVLVDYVLLALCWGTRFSEAAELQVENLKFEERLVFIPGETTKSGEPAAIPMTTWTEEILRGRLAWNEAWRGHDAGDWVFPSREHGKHIGSPRSVLLALEREAGVPIRIHDLRRALATDFSKMTVQHELTSQAMLSALAMHHSGATKRAMNDVTLRYMKDQADKMRPYYEKRERELKQLMGLPVEDPMETLTPEQKFALKTAADMMRRAGVDPAMLLKE